MSQSGHFSPERNRKTPSRKRLSQTALSCARHRTPFVVVETPVSLNEKQKALPRELEEGFCGAAGEENSPRSKSVPDGVKKFFDDFTR